MGVLLKKPDDVAGGSTPAILIGLFVAFGGVLFGYDTGTIGGIINSPYWLDHFHTGDNVKFSEKLGRNVGFITSTQSAEIVSILSAGTFFGALGAGYLGDLAGRRWALNIATLVFSLGVILQTAATHIPTFVAGRFFAGLGVGMVSCLVPLYQSETAPKWIRGSVVGAYQLAITIGLLLAAIVDNYTNMRDDSGSYRIPIAIQFAYAIILFVGITILPESPRWHVKKGRTEAAAKALGKLRALEPSHPAIATELAEITANHEYELSLGKSRWIDLFKGSIGFRTATGTLLQALQQLTGVNFIFYYGTFYFTQAGFQHPFVITMITSAVNVGSTFPGLYMVEKWGRRNLLMFGAAGMFVCQFIVAIVGTVTEGKNNLAAQNASIAFVCIYIFFFACSWGPCAWVVTGEIFPLKVRSKGLSLSTASNWLLNFAIGYATPYLVNNDPSSKAEGVDLKSKIFFIWGSFCLICFFFVWAMVYETKGLSLEQVDELYAKVKHAWQSPGFVPTVSFAEVKETGVNARTMSLSEAEGAAQRKKSITHEEIYTKSEL